ncbi:MAG: methionyl-tRNA formyltransferase [Acidobacteria bacterium]|nr:methionyl-tRNA formyltransferase [Acidobacteriota bacterium]
MNVVFFGTPEFAVAALDAIHSSRHEIVLAVAQPDRRAGRGMQPVRPPVPTRAEQLGIPLVQPAKIRTDEFLREIRERDPDIAVVVAYGRILPASLLEVPRHGFINAHASLLPKWRGAAPIQRAIEAGESVTGVTIMRIDEELDHGPVFSSREVPIGPDETSPDLFRKLAETGAELLVETLDRIEEGTATETPQDHEKATVAPMIDRTEGRVDWSLSAVAIHDRYRAFVPWPGTFCEIDGENVKLRKIRRGERSGSAGEILEIGSEAVEVACGRGSIIIERAQRPGRREVSGAELARSLGLEKGSRLG